MVAEFKGDDKGRLDGPWEWGLWDSGGSGKRNDLATVAAFIAAGGTIADVARQWPTVFIRNERGIRSYANLNAQLNPCVREVEGHYLWGDTGVGKSHWVYSTFGIANVYVVANESPLWFDGYSGQPVLFFEEFGSSVAITTMLKLVDGYPLLVPIKGGFVLAEWTRVILTGNGDVTGQWPKELKRRFGFPGGLGDAGNVYHCRWNGGQRTGFPSAERVGGSAIPFTWRVRKHAVPSPSVALLGDAGGGGSSSSSRDDDVSDASGLSLDGGPVQPVVQILPGFAVCRDGVTRENRLCSDPLCESCRPRRLSADAFDQ